MAFSSTSSTSVIMRTEERAFARLLSRAFTRGVWSEGAAERMSASIPKQALSWKRDGDGRVRTRILSSRLSRCDPRVAQPCIHAGRVERGAAEREDEREHVQASAFARKKETDARMRTPLARQAYECHARVLQYGMKSAGYAPPCIWVQLLRTLGRVVHTPNGDTDVHGEPLACRCARTAPPPSCRHRAATCTATAAHRRPPPASVLSSVCR